MRTVFKLYNSGFQTFFDRGPVGGPYNEKKVLSGPNPIELNVIVDVFLLPFKFHQILSQSYG